MSRVSPANLGPPWPAATRVAEEGLRRRHCRGACYCRANIRPIPRRAALLLEVPATSGDTMLFVRLALSAATRRRSFRGRSRGRATASGVPTVIGFLSGGTSIIAKNRPIPMLDFLLIIAAAETGPVERFRQDVTLLIFRRKETARNKRHTVAIGFALDLKWAVGGAHEPPGTARAVEPAYRSCRPG